MKISYPQHQIFTTMLKRISKSPTKAYRLDKSCQRLWISLLLLTTIVSAWTAVVVVKHQTKSSITAVRRLNYVVNLRRDEDTWNAFNRHSTSSPSQLDFSTRDDDAGTNDDESSNNDDDAIIIEAIENAINDVTEEKEVAIESAAVNWAKQQQQEQQQDVPVDKKKKKYVIVGAGWGGWGAAKALCENSGADSEVIILDTLEDPTGRTIPYVSKTNKPIEAGTRGFWKDYPNINQLCAELQLTNVFTDFTNSSFYSPSGLEATAPVFTNAKFPSTIPNVPRFLASFIEGRPIPNNLPSPLGQVLATFTLFERLPIVDRISMIGLLIATVDCLGSNDEKVLCAYDRMTAHELFIRFKLSERLVDDFIRPTLLVGLFKPPEELSALVVMELLYYYALAHTDSFDVRWIKNGTVSSSLIAPLATMLEDRYNLQIKGGSRVKTISTTPTGSNGQQHRVASIEYIDGQGQQQVIDGIDGVVLAVTSKGMNFIVNGSPDLAKYPTFTKAASCSGIDVISVRIWFDKIVPTRTPANVFAKFQELRGAGGTFFMLDQFQEDSLSDLWGDDDVQGSVVACDFYNAGALLALPDDEIIRTLTEDLLPSAVPAFESASVVDSWVGRYPGAVSWFAPGSFDKRPPLHGAGKDELFNLKCAGDWVRLGDREHGAKGLCQERAYVTGLEAANALLRESSSTNKLHTVLPVRDDEPQFRLAVAANREVMKYFPRFWVR
jgi:uncharacterized protein with NAD-binding domain and iron-sulfur cluster